MSIWTVDGEEVIVLGDTTTHGGEVITASDTIFYMNRPVARVGDLVTCPKCNGTHTIVSGAPTAFGNGRNIARNNDEVSCGATLISRANMAYSGTLYAAASNIATDAGGTEEEQHATLIVMINNNDIGHAAFRVGEGSSAILYDPAGTYEGCYKRSCKDNDGNPIARGTGDAFYGEPNEFEWDDYLAYHLNDGPKVTGYMFEIPQSQADTIKDLIINTYKGRGYFLCAMTVSGLLKDSGGIFAQLPVTRTPWGLADELIKVPTVKVIRY